VYDKQRRWFSEVIKVFGAGANYFEIFKATGDNPADTLSATPSSGPILIPAATISSILGGGSGNVRLVFRCKTNRGFADSDSRASGYNSAGRGAVLLDDVTISINGGGSPAGYGTFEVAEQGGANAIDNRFPLPPALTVNDVWRATGKPISPYIHAELLSNLTYNDLCGPSNSPARICNIGGVVLTVGNHDDGENAGDTRFTSLREVQQSMISPTMNLLTGAGGAVNSMGLRQSIASATDDIVLWYDMYAGMFNLSFSGEAWVYGHQSYPATQANGAKIWGQPVFPGFIIFNPEPQCFTDFEPFAGNLVPIITSNPSGIPDSLRVFLNHQQQCFRFAISLGCNSNEGGYFDNVSVAFIDLPGVPGQASASSTVSLGSVASDIWQLINDTFPANETAGLPGTAAFDTTSGLIRTGLNTAQATGTPLRFDIPGDSTAISAANATVGTADDPSLVQVRVDMVFRILPGPGNYRIAGGRTMAPGGNAVTGVLLQVPDQPGRGRRLWRRLVLGPVHFEPRSRVAWYAHGPRWLGSADVEQLSHGHAGSEHLPGRRHGAHGHGADAGSLHDHDPRERSQVRDRGCQQVQVLRHRHDEGREQLAVAEQRELHGRRPGVAHDGSADAHGLRWQCADEGVLEDHSGRHPDAGFARAVLLPQVARGRSGAELLDVPGYQPHHAAAAGKLHGSAPLAAVRRPPRSLEEQRVRRRRLRLHAVHRPQRPPR
jgi:hypothetical protein